MKSPMEGGTSPRARWGRLTRRRRTWSAWVAAVSRSKPSLIWSPTGISTIRLSSVRIWFPDFCFLSVDVVVRLYLEFRQYSLLNVCYELLNNLSVVVWSAQPLLVQSNCQNLDRVPSLDAAVSLVYYSCKSFCWFLCIYDYVSCTSYSVLFVCSSWKLSPLLILYSLWGFVV